MAESVIRNRFLELCEHLKQNATKLGFTVEQLTAETDIMTVEKGGMDETTQGWHFANFRYRGTIYIEQLPGVELTLLALLVRVWLDEFDDLRNKYKLAAPTIQSTKLADENYVAVIIQCDFVDDIYLTEVENGDIIWLGKTFDIAPFTVNYAETGTVNGAQI